MREGSRIGTVLIVMVGLTTLGAVANLIVNWFDYGWFVAVIGCAGWLTNLLWGRS